MALSSAASNCRGIFKCLAKPLPEPIGIIPKGIVVSVKTDATSFTVPSPPTAIILLALSSMAIFVKEPASKTLVVTHTLLFGIVCNFFKIFALSAALS